jgi:hypothetical protein
MKGTTAAPSWRVTLLGREAAVVLGSRETEME